MRVGWGTPSRSRVAASSTRSARSACGGPGRLSVPTSGAARIAAGTRATARTDARTMDRDGKETAGARPLMEFRGAWSAGGAVISLEPALDHQPPAVLDGIGVHSRVGPDRALAPGRLRSLVPQHLDVDHADDAIQDRRREGVLRLVVSAVARLARVGVLGLERGSAPRPGPVSCREVLRDEG